LIIALGATAFAAYNHINGLLSGSGDTLPMTSHDIVIELTQPIDDNDSNEAVKTYQYNNDLISVAIIGVDYAKGEDRGHLTDALMLLTVDNEIKKTSIISIPRDTSAPVDIYNAKGELVSTKNRKINSAYQNGTGDADSRYKNTLKCMSRVIKIEDFEVPIQHYIAIDMDGFGPITDAIGGVDVTLELSVGGVGKEGQTVHLNGSQALDFVRERNTVKGSDFGRARNQQLYIQAVARKIKQMGAVETVYRLYDEFLKYVETNLNFDQFIELAGILMDLEIESINHIVLTGEPQPDEQVLTDYEKAMPFLLDTFFAMK
jgi:LCP family protein required for cell wall assembly